MAEGFELREGLIAELGFDFQFVGVPLMMKARLGERGGGAEAVVDDAGEQQQRLRDDRGAAGGSGDDDWLAVLQNDGRAHARKRALACGDRIRLRADEFEGIRHARLHGEVVHLVIHEHAGVRNDDLAAKGRVDRLIQRHPVALGIGGAEEGGVFAENIPLPVRRHAVAAHRRDLREVDLLRQIGRVGRIDESAWHLREIGIAKPVRAICKGQLHRLRDDVHARGGIHRADRKRLQHVQDLRHVHAAGAGRRHGDQIVAAIRRADRFALRGLVVREIGRGHDAAVRLHPLRRHLSEGTFIKPRHALLGDRAIGLREVGLHQRITFRQRFAIAQENRSGGGELRELLRGGSELARIHLINREAFLRDLGRRQQHIGELELAVLLLRDLAGLQIARYTAGERAGLARFIIELAVHEIQVAMRGGGGHFTAVDARHGAVRGADDKETAATDAGVVPIDHAERQTGRDGRVDGVSALVEGLHGRLRGQRLHGCRGVLGEGDLLRVQQGRDQQKEKTEGFHRGLQRTDLSGKNKAFYLSS